MDFMKNIGSATNSILNINNSNYADSKTYGELWFQNPPYIFKYGKSNLFPLPISPSNLTIITHFANNLIPTLYSSVEEHSDQRYFDISIVGTTGIAPRYYQQMDSLEEAIVMNSRSAYGAGAIKAPLGFGAKQINQINKIKNQTSALINGTNFESGVFINNNGYVAFHNFYKFLLKYKSEINKSSKQSIPLLSTSKNDKCLIFLNYKDNQQYSCIISKFTLERSADNPMLYNYSIILRAYDLKTINGDVSTNDYLKSLMDNLGLEEEPFNLAKKIKNTTSSAKSIINNSRSLIGGF